MTYKYYKLFQKHDNPLLNLYNDLVSERQNSQNILLAQGGKVRSCHVALDDAKRTFQGIKENVSLLDSQIEALGSIVFKQEHPWSELVETWLGQTLDSDTTTYDLDFQDWISPVIRIIKKSTEGFGHVATIFKTFEKSTGENEPSEKFTLAANMELVGTWVGESYTINYDTLEEALNASLNIEVIPGNEPLFTWKTSLNPKRITVT